MTGGVTGGLAFADGALADLPGVMEVMQAAFEPRFGEAWTASQCAGLLPMAGVWLTIVRQHTEVVGFSMARMIVDEAELLLLAVRPDLRGQGIGKSLLNQFLATSVAGGAERVHLEVRDGNEAIRLYHAAGFTIAGRRKSYYCGHDGQKFDALSLSRPGS